MFFIAPPQVTTVFILNLLFGFFVSSSTAAQSCEQGVMISQFDEKSSPIDGFARKQIQRGEIAFANDPQQTTNKVVRFEAKGKLGREVGKADLIFAFPEKNAGNLISMSAKFYFPTGSTLDSIIVMDLECASCGVDTNPGIRLYLRRGLFRVDRSKIGIKEPMLPTQNRKVLIGEWNYLIWEVTLGVGDAGRSRVYLNDEKVMDVRGSTILTQSVVDRIAKIKVREQVDRFQIGITANSNKSVQVLYADDVAICFN